MVFLRAGMVEKGTSARFPPLDVGGNVSASSNSGRSRSSSLMSREEWRRTRARVIEDANESPDGPSDDFSKLKFSRAAESTSGESPLPGTGPGATPGNGPLGLDLSFSTSGHQFGTTRAVSGHRRTFSGTAKKYISKPLTRPKAWEMNAAYFGHAQGPPQSFPRGGHMWDFRTTCEISSFFGVVPARGGHHGVVPRDLGD